MSFLLDRYLLREVVHNWLWVTLVVWIILLSNRLVRYLGKAVSGDVPAGEVFTLLGLSSVGFLVILLPLSLFLGIILALGRLYKDSEMAALGACGVGARRLYAPLLGLAVFAAIAISWLSLVVAPAASESRHHIENRAEQRTDLSLIVPGRFQEFKDKKLVVYAQGLIEDQRQISNLFIESTQRGRSGLLTSVNAYSEKDASSGGQVLIMNDGNRYEGLPGQDDFRMMKFERYGIRLSAGNDRPPSVRAESKPSAELWHSALPKDRAELHWRLSAPVAVIILTLLAVPLSRTTPRKGQYGRLLAAVLCFTIYYNLLGTSRIWLGNGTIPAWLGLWWVHGMALVAVVLLLAMNRPERSGRKLSLAG